jgi:hypothetical protein
MRPFPALAAAAVLALLSLPVRAEDPPAGEPESEEARVARLVLAMKAEEPAQRLAAVEESRTVQAEPLVAALVRLVKDDSRSVREAVARSLAVRADAGARKKAAAALGARLGPLAKETDTGEILVVIRALHDLAEPASVKPLLEGIEIDTDPEVLRARVHAVGNVPTIEAVEELIRFAAKGRYRSAGGQRGSPIQAIEYATGRQFRNLDEIHVWWAHNKKTFDPKAAAAARAAARAEAEEQQRKREERQKGREERKKDGEKKEKEGGSSPPGGA